MPNELPFHEQVQAVIGRYLTGKISFDTAAGELAVVLRSLMKPSPQEAPLPQDVPGPRRLSIKSLSLADWMNPARSHPPVTHVLHAQPLVPGGTPEDEERAQALFEEAVRRAEAKGDAA